MSVHPLGRIASAAADRDRVMALLLAIDDVLECRRKAQIDGPTEAAEYLALQALNAAEEKLQAAVLDPALRPRLSSLLVILSDIAGSAA